MTVFRLGWVASWIVQLKTFIYGLQKMSNISLQGFYWYKDNLSGKRYFGENFQVPRNKDLAFESSLFLSRPPTEHHLVLRRRPGQKSSQGTVEQITWLVENCALPSPGQGQFVSNVSTNGAGSMIADSGWLAFLDSELCIVRCGDKFGLEFNCKRALKPVLWFCGGIGAAGGISVVFFRFERGSVQNRVCSLYSFLVEENQKAKTCLKGFGSSWEARWQ